MTAILPLDAGAIIGGHYSIDGLINTGGFGSVYRGTALSEGNRPCAIKETYDVTPAARRQALMEAAILFTVKTEHLPQVYDAFEESGRFYLVMQLIEGQNCSQMVKTHGGPFSEQEVLGWLLPIADVLQELHGRNPPVLHRDIKPANIILTPRGQAVLVDFGLTRLYDPGIQTQTMARAVSEGFSPLEQYIGQTSPQSDIYALAATMYFLLTAQVPPASVARSIQDTLIPPRQLNPQLTPKIENVLLKAMAINADQRFVSMQEFARALRAPGFTGHAEPTISQTRYEQANARTEMAAVPPPPPPPPASVSAWPRQGQAQVYQPVSKNPYAGPRQPGASRRPVQSSQPQQIGRAGRAIPPPAGGSLGVTYPPVPIQRPLPSPFGQGCLWGLIQGVLSALLVLWQGSKGNNGILLYALVEGFVFYLLAGFFTTRRGGRIARALRAGVWAGVTSTVMFWIVLPIGLVIAIAQQAQVLINQMKSQGHYISFNRAFSQIWNQFLPPRPGTVDVRGIVTFLVIGLLCAMGFALLGGLLGYKRNQR